MQMNIHLYLDSKQVEDHTQKIVYRKEPYYTRERFSKNVKLYRKEPFPGVWREYIDNRMNLHENRLKERDPYSDNFK